MKQEIRKTLYIVCEGTVTEPKYLKDLIDEIQNKVPHYKIKITPIPPKDKEDSAPEATYVRKSGPRRNMEEVEEEPEFEFVPVEFRAQPLEYVWKARESLKVYGEAWAVFDRDEHPSLQNALELAKQPVDEKFVNVAFSSRSFEFWLLLHFEQKMTPFTSTGCRTRTWHIKGSKRKKFDEPHQCGEDEGNIKDCKGEICITGYMKEKGYVDRKKDIKLTRFKGVIKDNVFKAIRHALELRSVIGNKDHNSIDHLDPYTDFDRLVFKLLYIEFDYQWIPNYISRNKNISISHFINGDMLNLKIENKSKIIFIVNPEEFGLLNILNEYLPLCSKKSIDAGSQIDISINLKKIRGFSPSYIRFPIDNNEIGITEIN